MTEQNELKEQAMNYAEYVRELIEGIRSAIITIQENRKDKFDEFDIHNALALTSTLIASRPLSEEEKVNANQQAEILANEMVKAALKAASENQVYLSSIILGSTRAVTALVEIVEAEVLKIEEEQKQEVSAE